MPIDQASSLADLVRAMDGGQVEMLLILGGNPVYTAPADLKFGDRLAKVALTVYHGLYGDETANQCHWNLPAAHALESWGDARAYDGTVTLIQPLIAPLYEGRTAHEVLTIFTQQPDRRGHDIIKDYWTRAFGSGMGWTFRDAKGQPFRDAATLWRHALHDGFLYGTAIADGGPATPFVPAPLTAPSSSGPAAAASAAGRATGAGVTAAAGTPRSGQSVQQPSSVAQVPASGPAQGGLEIVFRPDPTVWDGSFTNNGWLQELPKPLTKLTWDTAAWVSPRLAEQRGLQNGDVIELKYRGNTAHMPVFIVPGQPAESVTVFFGYGRKVSGRVGTATRDAQDFNAYLLRTSDAPWFGNGLEIAKTGQRYLLATTQEHHLMEGRAPVRTATLEQYRREPALIAEQGEKPPKTLTLYPEHRYDGYKWGMAIDLTTCTGCSACTIACVAENNIPVVGKEQVSRGREMRPHPARSSARLPPRRTAPKG
jgi:molybdopterin-containing oxidoreductase family iron-sulfur binding subunit